MSEIVGRVIAAVTPEEPPPGSVVLTGKGLAYQREPEDVRQPTSAFDGPPPSRWWPAVDGASFGHGALSWPLLLARGPVLLVTDAKLVQGWLDSQTSG